MSSIATLSTLSKVEDRVLSESIASPPVALIRLGLEIDRQLRLLLAVSHKIREYKGSDPPAAAALLQDWLAPELVRSIEAFWKLRESIVGSSESIPSFVGLSAIESGLRILRTLASIPRPNLIVEHPRVLLFQDEQRVMVRTDVWGIVLQWVDPIGRPAGTTWYPTRRTYFEGERVSWEWLPPGSELKGSAWYQDPLTRNLQPVDLGFHMEFIGRDLETI